MQVLRDADGRRLAYELRGRGRPVVCHPGGPGLSSRALGDLGGLGGDFQLVLLDPRGTGGSDRPASGEGYRLTDFVGDLELLREHLELPRMALLGHSAGARIALTYAATYPQYLECLVLVGAAARYSDEHAEVGQAMMAARSHEPWYAEAAAAGEEYVRADRSVTDAEFAAIVARGMPFCFARYGPRERAYATVIREDGVMNAAAWLGSDEPTHDLRPLLGQITAPALVIAGEADCVVVPPAARELAEGLPRGQLMILRDAGHYPWVEQPDRFRTAVNGFLDDH